jgi:TP901 family phage tail tape measure protein
MEIQKLFVSLLLDAADYTGGLNDAQKEASSFRDRVGKTIGDGFKAAGAIATTALLAIATTAAGVAVGAGLAFVNFQGQMNEVFTLLPGISQDAMDDMSGQVLQFSKDFAVLPEKVVPALYQSLSAGVPQDNVFSFLEIAQKAAVGGVTELETAVDGITSVMNAYGSDVVDAASASDIMFTAVRLGKTDFNQLSSSLFNVIPTAASLGVEFGDVAAQLATLTAQGTPTSVATTQIRSAMVEASKSGTNLSDAIQDLTGKSFAELIESGESMPGIFEDLRQSMPEQDFKDLFGSVEAMNAVLGVTGPNFDAVSAAMDEMADSTGATDAAYDTMNRGIGRSIERFKAFGSAVLIQIGGALEPIINAVVSFAEGALPKIENVLNTAVIPAIENITFFIGEFMRGLQATGDPLAALEEALDNFLTEEQLAAVWAFNDGLREVVARIGEFIEPIAAWIASHVEIKDVLIALGILLASVILPILGSLLLSILAIAAPIVAVIAIVALLRTAWEQNWGGIQEKTAAAVEFIRGVITAVMAGVQAFWAENGEAIMAKAREIWTGIQTAVNTAITTIQTIITTISTAIQTFWATHGETIMAAAATAWEFIQGIVETVTSVISTVFAAFKLAFEGDWEGFGETLRTAWDTAWAKISEIFTTIKDTIIEIAAGLILDLIAKFQDTDWAEVGWGIVNGIAGAITAGAGAIAEAAKNAAQAALDAAKAFLGIDSPSKVAALQIGEPFTEGLALGLGDVAPIQRSVSDLVNEMTLPFATVQPQINATTTATAVSSPALSGGGSSTTINIDARGTDAPTVDRLRGIIREELATSGRRADVRIRTG